MAAGVPAVVSNVGAFAELPADCVIKIDTDEYSEALLLAYLKRLLEDADLRRRIGNNARRYVVSEHSIEQSAASYIKFVRDVINRRPRKQLLDSISSELSLLGVHEANDVLMRNVAEEVATLAPLRLFESAAYFYQAEGDHGPSKTIFHDNRSEPLPESAVDAQGRLSKIEGIDYKRAAVEYPRKLDAERYHYLLTKPFYNLANKPPKHLGDGMDPETHRHFCDFANMAVALALPPGSRILDVGCGSGWLSEYFARLGYEVTGIDVSDDLIRMARERVAHVTYEVDHQTPLRCRFLAHDIESASLAEQFDAIICYDSLHHFEDEQSTMRHLAAMLPMGGLLFVLEGNKPPAGSATEEELIGVMQHYETLESPFSPEYLRQLLVVNGFALVGDYVSVNGLFSRDELEDHQLRIDLPEVNYLLCKKVAEGLPASNVPDSQIPGRLQAKITLVSEWREQVACGEVVQAALEIINIGDTLWLTGQVPRRGVVMLGVKLFDEAGTLIEEFHGQPPLPRALGPGEHAELKIRFEAPQKSGKYRMKIDLVDQQICWFEEHDSQPLILFFTVY
jgi:SAM-dependent methyltransferase